MIAVNLCRHGMELAATVGTKHGEQCIARGLAVEMCVDEDLPSIIHRIAVKDVVLGRLYKGEEIRSLIFGQCELENTMYGVAEDRAVHIDRIALDDAQILQPLQPVLHRLTREVHLPSQICHGNTAILFKRIDDLDIGSVIYPKYITADYILQYVRAMQNTIGSNVETLYHILDNQAEALEFAIRENSPVTGIPLSELNLKKNLLVGYLNRNGQVKIPRGQDTIQVGDTVIIVTSQKGLRDITDILEK